MERLEGGNQAQCQWIESPTALAGTSRLSVSVKVTINETKETWNPVARQKDLQTLARLEVTPTSDPIEARRSL